LWPTVILLLASHSALPLYAHGSVPVWWLTFDRAGLSGLHAPALPGALIVVLLSGITIHTVIPVYI